MIHVSHGWFLCTEKESYVIEIYGVKFEYPIYRIPFLFRGKYKPRGRLPEAKGLISLNEALGHMRPEARVQ